MLKSIDNLFCQDERFKAHLCDHYGTPYDWQCHYSEITQINLIDDIPTEIKMQFDIARNIALYSYFYWELLTISLIKSVDCVELAVKEFLKEKKENIKNKDGKDLTLEVLFREMRKKGYFKEKYQPDKITCSFKDKLAPINVKMNQKCNRNEVDIPYCREKFPCGSNYFYIETHIISLRNSLVHGNKNIFDLNTTFHDIKICCNIINCLYSGVEFVKNVGDY